MEKKTQAILLLSIVVIYRILWYWFYKFIPSDINNILSIIWFLILIFFIYWLSKNTDYFKKVPLKERPAHSLKVFEELGFISVIVWACRIMGFLGVVIFGFLLLFKANTPDEYFIFSTMVILGLILISLSFFWNRMRPLGNASD